VRDLDGLAGRDASGGRDREVLLLLGPAAGSRVTRGAAGCRDQQPLVREPLDHRPGPLPDLGQAGAPPGVLGALPGPDELQEDALDGLLLGFGEAPEHLLGLRRDGALQPPHGLVCRMEQPPALPVVPEALQHELQQREVPRLVPDVVEDGLD
jgi:hypothetical protein